MTNTFLSIWFSVYYHFELNVLYMMEVETEVDKNRGKKEKEKDRKKKKKKKERGALREKTAEAALH